MMDGGAWGGGFWWEWGGRDGNFCSPGGISQAGSVGVAVLSLVMVSKEALGHQEMIPGNVQGQAGEPWGTLGHWEFSLPMGRVEWAGI